MFDEHKLSHTGRQCQINGFKNERVPGLKDL